MLKIELKEEPPQNQISAFPPTTASAAMNYEVEEPPQKKKNTTTFSSLPEEIIVSCLARLPKSYYPKLSLVSKSFCSLVSFGELHIARTLETKESVFYVCLQFPDRRVPSWFSLWIKPDQTLTIDLIEKDDNNKSSTGNTKLVPVPSSYSPLVPPLFFCKVGSKTYSLRQSSSSNPQLKMFVCKDGSYNKWRKARRSMKVAREYAVAGILDGKIYVMGGCEADETENWAEVYDTKTRTWESLPDPGAELRASLLKSMRMIEGKVYVDTSEKKKCYVYDLKEGTWDVVEKAPVPDVRGSCTIDDVWYRCCRKGFFWYDIKRKEWRQVKGLEVFRNCGGGFITLANYGGKLLALWDKSEQPGGQCQNKNIWCSVINLERRNGGDEVWGDVEWASVVLTVPSSYVFLRYQVKSV